MKSLFHVFTLAGFVVCAQTANRPGGPSRQPPACNFAGTLVDSVTQQPLALQSFTLDTTAKSVSVKTDGQGKFSYPDLPSSWYRMSATRQGYAPLPWLTPSAFAPNGMVYAGVPCETLQNVTLHLDPQAVISGRVKTPDGQAIANVDVLLLEAAEYMGKQIYRQAGRASSNDLGDYRIFGMQAGTYLLVAVFSKQMNSGYPRTDQPPPSDPVEEYLPTYYPKARDMQTAIPITLKPGASEAADITLIRGPTVTVSGTVKLSQDHSGPNTKVWQAFVELRQPGSDQPSTNFLTRSSGVNPQGRFEIAGVPPGSYDLVESSYLGRQKISRHRAVQVGNSSLTDLQLGAPAGVSLKGKISGGRAEDGKEISVQGGLQVFLAGRAPLITGQVSTVSRDDGSFSFDNLSPERYEVRLTRVPPNTFVSAMRCGDRDAMLFDVNLEAAGCDQLTVTLSRGAGSVSGTLESQSGPAALARVLLAPAEPLRRTMHNVRVVTTNQSGVFVVPNLEPGEYKVWGWQFPGLVLFREEAFMRSIEDKGQSIKVEKNSEASVKLRAIDAAPSAKP